VVFGFDADVNGDVGDVVEGSEVCTRPEELRAEGICEWWVNCWFGEGFWYQEWYVQPNFPLLLVLYGDTRGAVGRR